MLDTNMNWTTLSHQEQFEKMLLKNGKSLQPAARTFSQTREKCKEYFITGITDWNNLWQYSMLLLVHQSPDSLVKMKLNT